MRYMDDTKMFWKLGWRLFGGKFVRFMSGFKNTTQIIGQTTERGHYDPQISDINFAVPDLRVLREYSPYGEDDKHPRLPGLYPDIMKVVADTLDSTSACLSFDGKKLKQGLTRDSGDIDLLGFEDTGMTLCERKETNLKEISSVHEVTIKLQNENKDQDVWNIDSLLKSELVHVLRNTLVVLSRYTNEIRKIKEKKEYARQKFISRSGPDWRHGQFTYVISAICAFLYDINNFLENHRKIIDDICYVVSILHGSSMYRRGDNVDLSAHPAYHELQPETDSMDPRNIKQRSPKWFEMRSNALVTGSTIYSAAGLDGLKKQREHFDKVICKVESSISEQVQKNMEYGTDNEINAVATLVTKVIPVLYPDLEYREEGCVPLYRDGKQVMIVSPDGSLEIHSDDGQRLTKMAVELKCPVLKLHNSVPERYILQCLSEMQALEVDKLVYLCWRPDVSSVFELSNDQPLFHGTLNECLKVVGDNKPKRPTKLSTAVPGLQERVKENSLRATFMGEFPSAKSAASTNISVDYITKDFILEILQKTTSLIRDGYELQRQKASEAMVFLSCDLDRNWSKDQMRWAPVAWFPKGYSLTTDVFRNIVEKVHNECHDQGIHIPCESFDGQWHNIAVRTLDHRPLTILQLQKDVWHEVEKLQKSEIVKLISNLNRNVDHKKIDDVIKATNGGIRLPVLSLQSQKQKKRDTKENEDTEMSNKGNLVVDHVSAEIVEEISSEAIGEAGVNTAVMNYVTLDVDSISELQSCNASKDSWIGVYHEAADPNNSGNCQGDESEDLLILNEQEQLIIESQPTKPTRRNICVSTEDLNSMLLLLRSEQSTNKKGQWDSKDVHYLRNALESAEALGNLRDVDIKVIVRYLRNKKITDIKVHTSKTEKIIGLCKLLGLDHDDTHCPVPKRKHRISNPKCLKDLCVDILSRKISKHCLNITWAEYIWPERLKLWRQDSPLQDCVKLGDSDYPEFWFYQPEYSTRRAQLEVRCIDSSHLLTRIRRKCCKGGIENLSNNAWIDVANSKATLLTPIMVEDVVDPMSVPMAVSHFREDVGDMMRVLGHYKAASLCHDILQWWKSEDEPGISAHERINMRKHIRHRLLQAANFSKFPPQTSYVNGWPIQLWEAMISNIDAKAILYSLAKQGTYNVRAFSSMMGETFFSEVTNQDRTGSHGTLTCKDFANFIGASLEQMKIRLDADRPFSYRAFQSTVYNLVDADEPSSQQIAETGQQQPNFSSVSQIIPRDHFFDTHERKRVLGKKRVGTISTGRNDIEKGSLGVRWEKARLNQAKMLPTKRMGISD